MEMPRPSDEDKQRFKDLVPDVPGVEIRPMFGNLGAFVNGNMFMGLFGAAIGLKLPDEERDKLLAVPGSGPFGPADRPMGGYATLPADWTPRKTRSWVDKALQHSAVLPPKEAKRRSTKTRATDRPPTRSGRD